MRVPASRYGAVLLVVCACTAEIPSGVIACDHDSDCPSGFLCRSESGAGEHYCFDRDSAPEQAAEDSGASGALPKCDSATMPGVLCVPRTATSCARAELTCGEDGENCCAAATVVAGRYYRSYDESMDATQDGESVEGWEPKLGEPVQVDAFALDRYEVTVARFRAFVADYDGWILSNPVPGAGGGAPGTEWKASFRSEWDVVSSARDMTAAIEACPDSVWVDDSRGSDMDALPMNCLTWFEAYLFCLWDGGRLPTEAEWNYAAAGGDQQRPFPWSAPPYVETTGATSHAVIAPSSGALPVGTFPEGEGRWGQLDLAGNVWEWVFDADERAATNFTPGSYPACAGQSTREGCVVIGGPSRVFRGGSFKFGAAQARTAYRHAEPAATRYSDLGVRCARDL